MSGPEPSLHALRETLAGDRPVILDGALATELEARGLDLSDPLWSARLLIDDPAAIEDVHAAYLAAGARVVITASYQASAEGFAALGVDAAGAARLLQRSVRLAQRARERAGAAAAGALVAASVGPYGAVLAGGQEYTGDYGPTTDQELEDFHERRLRALIAAGPDCIACETIPRAGEAAVLVRVLDRLGAPDAWISFACRDGRTTAHGEPIEDAVAQATLSRRVVAVGVNCTAPEHVAELLERAARVTDLPLVAYPNSGRAWDAGARAFTGGGAASIPEGDVRSWVAAGARLVGGCCGLGPGAIRGIAQVLHAP
ncbi:MAG: homocysteine S-methyltransferase [Solirubrobacteraceae bacterium]|nr:homocysteine S-methyltransferase [Solirubrobacteraceae bacterium]